MKFHSDQIYRSGVMALSARKNEKENWGEDVARQS